MCLRKAWLYRVQRLLYNFHMLPQVQLCPSIASYINKHYGQNTNNKAATNENNNKLFISYFLGHSAMDNSRCFWMKWTCSSTDYECITILCGLAEPFAAMFVYVCQEAKLPPHCKSRYSCQPWRSLLISVPTLINSAQSFSIFERLRILKDSARKTHVTIFKYNWSFHRRTSRQI